MVVPGTHHPRDPVEMEGGTTYHFVTEGIESALRTGQAGRGRERRHGLGRRQHRQQYLAAGLLDELELHAVPLLLGDGARPFPNRGDAAVPVSRGDVAASAR